MKRQKIESSNITSIGYDLPTLTLEIKFKNKAIYQYWPIGRYTYDSLMKAKSIGGYFSREIRGNTNINYRKVDEI